MLGRVTSLLGRLPFPGSYMIHLIISNVLDHATEQKVVLKDGMKSKRARIASEIVCHLEVLSEVWMEREAEAHRAEEDARAASLRDAQRFVSELSENPFELIPALELPDEATFQT